MIHTGISNFIEAESEELAIAKAIADLEASGMIPHETPLFVEDQGDGTFEVVLRRRISTFPPTVIVAEPGSADTINDFLEARGLTVIK